MRQVTRDLERLQDLKEKLAEYNFQTITIILGVLTLVAVVPFAILHGGQVATGTLALGIFVILLVDTAMAAIWMVLWTWLNFRAPKGSRAKSGSKGPPKSKPT
ncbi:MAG: hypothetical protein L3K16_09225 [Thermoplasmata archaeon]|nr:hypothetical protein [Thermoplasmata archaeon]